MSKKTETNVKQRRKALKLARNSAFAAAAATQIPKEWKKPVINSVILPAHAATTGNLGSGTTTTSTPSTTPTASTTSNAGNAGNASDIRLKTEIQSLTKTPDGLQLYRFQYKNDPLEKTHVGLMAQDLASSHPQVLGKNADGYFMVRYDLLGLQMTSLEEWDQYGMDSVLLAH